MGDGESVVTRSVRSGVGSDRQFAAVMPPLYLSSNFVFSRCGQPGQYDYTRSGNPTRDGLAHAIVDLEGGAAGVITASGMAAVAVVLQLVGNGERVVAPHDCYGGTFRILHALARRGALALDLVDMTDPPALAAALERPARMVWLETPSNPLLRITEIRSVVAQARARGSLVVADNTFLTPVLQRPLALGADIVVHSTTKYLNGHSDVVGGAIIAGDSAVGADLAWWANCLGVTGAPFDSYLTLRGLRTLHVRMDRHQENAAAVVEALVRCEAVARVYYPGLAGHPGHQIAARQQDGFGAMVSFELDHARAVDGFVERLQTFTLAESLGGVESLVSHPATMTHASMTPLAREAAGITPALLRLSVGIESERDLVNDLVRAARAVSHPAGAG